MMRPQYPYQCRQQKLNEHVQGGDEEGSREPEEIRGKHPFVVHRQYGGKQIPTYRVSGVRGVIMA